MKNQNNQPQFANTAAGPSSVVAFSNELTIDADGWAMICPIGDYPSPAILPDGKGGFKTEPAIQRIDQRAVQQMAAKFANDRKGLKKYLRGVPIYVGHPDVPGLEKKYPDKTPYGVIADIQARENGLYGQPVFTNAGSDLVENPDPKKRLRAFSGNIGNAEPDGHKGTIPIFRPTELFSAGLTNNPHLPVQYLNEMSATAGETKPTPTMKKKLLALIAALSLKPAFANEAEPTDPETEAAVELVTGKVTALVANENSIKTKLLGLAKKCGLTFANEAAITDAPGVIGQIEQRVVEAIEQRDSARTSFANERTAHTKSLLDSAVATGRITEAQRATWDGRLKVEANFANESAAILALKSTVKTEHATAGRVPANADTETPESRRQFLNEAIDSVCKEKGFDRVKDYDKAFNIVQKTHAAFFATMDKPEVAGRRARKS